MVPLVFWRQDTGMEEDAWADTAVLQKELNVWIKNRTENVSVDRKADTESVRNVRDLRMKTITGSATIMRKDRQMQNEVMAAAEETEDNTEQ